jgi:hypothetical protein
MQPPETSPLGTLLALLPSCLEGSRSSAVDMYASARSRGRLTGRITISGDTPRPSDSRHQPRGPYATHAGDLVLPLDFAERLWAASLALLVRCDAELVDQMRRRGQVTDPGPPSHVIAATDALLARALAGPLWPWPDGAPTPDAVFGAADATPRDLAWWVGRANSVFLDAATYLLAHEAAHVLQAHAGTMADAKAILADAELARNAARAAGVSAPLESDREAAARQTALEIEREADAAARDALFGADADGRYKLPRGFAAVLACTASVLLAGSPRGLRQVAHPDLDVRLRQTLEALDPERGATVVAGDEDEPDGNDALWRVAAIGLLMAMNRWDLRPSLKPEVGSWAALTFVLFDHLEAVKPPVLA